VDTKIIGDPSLKKETPTPLIIDDDDDYQSSDSSDLDPDAGFTRLGQSEYIKTPGAKT
jgi:hypothetical protein